MDSMGFIGKSFLALIIGGLVFAWAWFFGLIFTAPEGQDPTERLADLAVEAGLIEQPPIVAAGVTWTVDEALWRPIGTSWRARIVLTPNRYLDSSFNPGGLIEACSHVLREFTGAPLLGPARAAPPYRIDVVVNQKLEGARVSAFPFLTGDGRCVSDSGKLGVALAPPLTGWRVSDPFETELSDAEVAFNYPAYRKRGPIVRRTLFISTRGAAPLTGAFAGPPRLDHLEAACEMLMTEVDFTPFAEGRGFAPPSRTIPREVGLAFGASKTRLDSEPVVFRASENGCTLKDPNLEEIPTE